MSEGINTAWLQGELAWPELRYQASGVPLFTAKVKVPSADFKTGEQNFTLVKIVAWEELAEYMGTLPEKTKVRVSGRIQERSFVNKEGAKQSSTEVVLEGVEVVDSAAGENAFILQGEVVWPELKKVGPRESSLLRAKIKIPFVKRDGTLGSSFVRITAWDEFAEGLSSLGEGSQVQVSGHIQDRSWVTPTGQKRIFTDMIVTNFTGA